MKIFTNFFTITLLICFLYANLFATVESAKINQKEDSVLVEKKINTIEELKADKEKYIISIQKKSLLRAKDSIELEIKNNINNPNYDVKKQNYIIEQIINFINTK